MKRLFDLILAGLGLLVLSPLFALLAAAIKLSDGGSAFFTQERIGQGGRPFRMLKFRSMVMGADRAGALLTVGQDRRITAVGRVLRATKLDELPQLWNVVRGEMSLVGPRPEVERYVVLYTPEQQEVLRLRPGITDPASFALYDEAALLAQASDPHVYYQQHLMAEKIRINLDYAAKRNLWTDLILILATVGKGLGLHFDIFAWLKIRPPDFGELV